MTVQEHQKAETRVAPFGATATVIAVTAIVVLSQLYGAIPLFAPVQESFDFAGGAVAWVQTSFGIAYAAGFIAWGPAVDRFGLRRVMLVGLCALSVATVATSVAPTASWFLTGRAVQGALAASFAPAAFAYLGARPARARRAVSITVLTSSFLASAVIGQVAAQVATERLDWPWFFWLGAAALALSAFAVRAVLLPDIPSSQTANNPARILGRLLRRVPVIVLLVATVLVLGPMIALYTAIGAAAVTDSSELLLLRASALPALVWAPFGTRWLSRVSPPRRLTGAFIMAGIAAAAVALVPDNVIGTGIAMFGVAAAVAVAAPAMIQTLAGHAPESQGSATALYTCFLFFGASIAPAIVTTTAASVPSTAVTSGLMSVAAAALVILSRTHPIQTSSRRSRKESSS